MPNQPNTSDREVALPGTNRIIGTRARLFPSVADSSRENRLTSIFLAVLPQIPELAKDLLGTVGVSVGKHTKIECWTEVEFENTPEKDKRKRPDGLIVVTTGKKTWTALVEAKIKDNAIDEVQLNQYLKMARECKVNAMITISNQFVARADHSPTSIKLQSNSKVSLYHWSWTYIQTRCGILSISKDAVQDDEQAFMLKEFVRFLDHKDTGVKRFNSMGTSWKALIDGLRHNTFREKSKEVLDCVGNWHQEERDLSLLLSRLVASVVTARISPNLKSNPRKRLEEGAARLVREKELVSIFDVPYSAAPIRISAHLSDRCLTFSMKLDAPKGNTTTQGRVGWLLRMLNDDKEKKSEQRLLVRAHWPGRAQPTLESLSELRGKGNWKKIEKGNKGYPHAFEVILQEDLGRSFEGPEKFIQKLEEGVETFYKLVGRRLKKYQPSPLQPRTQEISKQNNVASPEGDHADLEETVNKKQN